MPGPQIQTNTNIEISRNTWPGILAVCLTIASVIIIALWSKLTEKEKELNAKNTELNGVYKEQAATAMDLTRTSEKLREASERLMLHTADSINSLRPK